LVIYFSLKNAARPELCHASMLLAGIQSTFSEAPWMPASMLKGGIKACWHDR